MNHSFEPFVHEESEILILGSFPSMKSLKNEEYYANPKNQFWEILQTILGNHTANTYEERLALLEMHNIALWDIVKTTQTPQNPTQSGVLEFNDIEELLLDYDQIRFIYCNGNASYTLFKKNIQPTLEKFLNVEVYCLPSTSPANADISLKDKVTQWQILKDKLKL